jgi:peptide/nickel transport system permease protein
MTQYIVRRLLLLPVTWLGLSLLVFAMLQLLDPAERAALYVPSPPHNPQALAAIIQRYGLDQPIYVQYLQWLGRVLAGDLGWSRTTQQPVVEAILTYFPATLELTLYSFPLIILGGVWLGVQAALRHNRPVDQLARIFSITGYSFPTFVCALLLLMVFYATVPWFPPGRLSDWATALVYSAQFHPYTRLITVDALLNGRLDLFVDALRHLLLPVLTLAYASWALIVRVMRSSMLEVLRQEYITVAHAKGLPRRGVINRHGRPNALIPVVTLGGLLLANLLGGAVLVEVVFDFHGLGWWAARAALSLDAVSVLGVTLFNGTLLVLVNLAVDVLYVLLDPRIRLK